MRTAAWPQCQGGCVCAANGECVGKCITYVACSLTFVLPTHLPTYTTLSYLPLRLLYTHVVFAHPQATCCLSLSVTPPNYLHLRCALPVGGAPCQGDWRRRQPPCACMEQNWRVLQRPAQVGKGSTVLCAGKGGMNRWFIQTAMPCPHPCHAHTHVLLQVMSRARHGLSQLVWKERRCACQQAQYSEIGAVWRLAFKPLYLPVNPCICGHLARKPPKKSFTFS